MKITITIEDTEDGHVRTVFDPPAAPMFKRIQQGIVPTSAEAYALRAANAFREVSNENTVKPVVE